MPETGRDAVALDRSSAERMGEATRFVEGMVRGGGGGRRVYPAPGRITAKVAYSLASGVPARSGSTCGAGTVRLRHVVSGVLVDGDDVSVINWSTTVVPAFVHLIVTLVDGVWTVVTWEC